MVSEVPGAFPSVNSPAGKDGNPTVSISSGLVDLDYPAPMSFVALATCLNLPEPDFDEPILLAALERAGVPARLVAWDDDTADWDDARVTIIRSTWNYYLRPGPFLAWVLRRGDRLWNPPEIVRWNHHKQYLRDLEARGVPVVPTAWVPQHASVADALAARDWKDIVVKPAISAGSYKTTRFSEPPFDRAALDALSAHGETMVQPYVASVDGYGERSLVCIDGEITHAIRKAPRFHGGVEQVSDEAVDIADDERALAREALARVSGKLLYARIDMVRDAEGKPMVSELELIEPSLFLRQSPRAVERLVAAIGQRFEAAR
jgi:glutathione synthase/RimK-type ligase-like ATP-grasp enzyme